MKICPVALTLTLALAGFEASPARAAELPGVLRAPWEFFLGKNPAGGCSIKQQTSNGCYTDRSVQPARCTCHGR